MVGAVECIYRDTMPAENTERQKYTGARAGITLKVEEEYTGARSGITLVVEKKYTGEKTWIL